LCARWRFQLAMAKNHALISEPFVGPFTVTPTTVVTISFDDVPEMKPLPGAWVNVVKGGVKDDEPVPLEAKSRTRLSSSATVFVPSTLSSNAQVFVPWSETKADRARMQDGQRLQSQLSFSHDHNMDLGIGKQPRTMRRESNAVILTITPTGWNSLDLSIIPSELQRTLHKCKPRRHGGHKGGWGARGSSAVVPSSNVKKQKPPAPSVLTKTGKSAPAVRPTDIKSVHSNSEHARLLTKHIMNATSGGQAARDGTFRSTPSICAEDLFHDGLPLKRSAADELKMLMSVGIPDPLHNPFYWGQA